MNRLKFLNKCWPSKKDEHVKNNNNTSKIHDKAGNSKISTKSDRAASSSENNRMEKRSALSLVLKRSTTFNFQ